MAQTITSPSTPTKPPFWRNVNVLRVVAQIVAVLAVAAAIRWLFGNLTRNLEAVGIDTDFDFLDSPARFQIRDSSFDPDSSIRLLLLNGIKNTFAAAIVGITIAIILGTLIGIARLSNNWILRKLAQLYVETLRNIPPLVIIIFFGFAVFTFGRFPLFNPANPPGEIKFPGTDSTLLIYSKTRLGIPSLENGDGSGLFWAIVVVGLAIAIGVWLWRTKVNVDTGQPHHRVIWSLATFVGIGVIAWIVLGQPVTGSFPAVSESGRLIEGGFATNDGYVSLTIALALYTASHIAEIVRGSILAVPKGQNEASNALALSGFQRYRFVVLPQAARIAVPPVINQFLNLTKNTSLAVAVAYPDVTQLTRTAIGNDQPSPQMILILMGIYLSFSLTISLVLNIINRRFQLPGR